MSGGRSVNVRRLRAWRAACAGFAALPLCVVAAGCGGGGPGLVLEHNALLADSPFDTAAQTSSLAPTFRLGGTATLSDASVRVRSDGLYVDVGPHRLGTWRGFFVATGATYPADSVGGAWVLPGAVSGSLDRRGQLATNRRPPFGRSCHAHPRGDAPVRTLTNAHGQARALLPLNEAAGTGTFTIAGPHLRRRFTGVAYAGGDVYRFSA